MTLRRAIAVTDDRPAGASPTDGPVTAPHLQLVRLLQLASPALPIGAYSYSQGLEWAAESRQVGDGKTAQTWIGDVLEEVIAPGEAAVLWRLLVAASREDWVGFSAWNAWFRASRETAERNLADLEARVANPARAGFAARRGEEHSQLRPPKAELLGQGDTGVHVAPRPRNGDQHPGQLHSPRTPGSGLTPPPDAVSCRSAPRSRARCPRRSGSPSWPSPRS